MTKHEFSHIFIDKYGICKFFDDFGGSLLNDYNFVQILKQNYPKDNNKIRLWEILHGVVKPINSESEINTIYYPLSFNIPQTKSKLNINDTILISSPQSTPNRWQRFWYKKLLGWKWEKVDKT
jgi:hypothetical protein